MKQKNSLQLLYYQLPENTYSSTYTQKNYLHFSLLFQENMAKSANSSNEEITKFSQCQNCKRYFEMEISLQDHFQNNEKCKQNHNREQQIIYIECPGPCTKKTYFKFGKSIEMHLKKSKCSKEVPSTFLPRLKKEFFSRQSHLH